MIVGTTHHTEESKGLGEEPEEEMVLLRGTRDAEVREDFGREGEESTPDRRWGSCTVTGAQCGGW